MPPSFDFFFFFDIWYYICSFLVYISCKLVPMQRPDCFGVLFCGGRGAVRPEGGDFLFITYIVHSAVFSPFHDPVSGLGTAMRSH